MIKYADFVNKHHGRKALIIALGESALKVRGMDLSHLVTIGVNDVDRVFVPNYVVTLDEYKTFEIGRAETIMRTKAERIFTHIKDWEKSGKAVMFALGRKGTLLNLNNPGVLDISCNSPYVAMILAYQMGCTSIGVIGLDFTDNHCYAKDGAHILVRANRMPEIEQDFKRLSDAMLAAGRGLWNLSDTSILKALPKYDFEKFIME